MYPVLNALQAFVESTEGVGLARQVEELEQELKELRVAKSTEDKQEKAPVSSLDQIVATLTSESATQARQLIECAVAARCLVLAMCCARP